MPMDLKYRPRIGLMAVGLAAYWPQFTEMKSGVLEHHARMREKFVPFSEIVDGGLVDSIEAARKCGEAFQAADVDLVFCHLTTYATSEPLVLVVRELNVPVVFLNVQSVKALDLERVRAIENWLGIGCTCAGLPEMTASMIRLGKRFDVITGFLTGDSEVDFRISQWCAVAAVRRRLRTSTFGLLGRPYAGMTDLYLDETGFFGRFGVYTRHLQWDDIVSARLAIEPDQVAARIGRISEAFDVSEGPSPERVREIAEVICSLDRLVEEFNLTALPNHYEGTVRPEHVAILAASNPAFSILMSEGIACPVEADIKVALAMVMLKQVASSATLAELYSMDFLNDICLIGHSGAADLSIAPVRPRLRRSEVFHGKSGSGYLTQVSIPEGRLTLLSLTQGVDGEFRLVAAEGDIVDGPVLELGDTNCRARFSCGLREFVRRWASAGPTHHGVMSTGGHLESISLLAKMFDLQLDIVTA
jgi:L-arabinose isomerase